MIINTQHDSTGYLNTGGRTVNKNNRSSLRSNGKIAPKAERNN